MNDFLPKDYAMPESERRYMEFEEGANTFRILSPAIVGYEWWEETGNGDRVPVRVRTAEEVPQAVRNATDSRDKAKHFWAFSVSLMLDSRVLRDQKLNKRVKQRFASLSDVVHKLKATQVKRELLL